MKIIQNKRHIYETTPKEISNLKKTFSKMCQIILKILICYFVTKVILFFCDTILIRDAPVSVGLLPIKKTLFLWKPRIHLIELSLSTPGKRTVKGIRKKNLKRKE